jgi:hypothetical protein
MDSALQLRAARCGTGGAHASENSTNIDNIDFKDWGSLKHT